LEHCGTERGSHLYRKLNQVLMLLHSGKTPVAGQRVDVNLIDLLPTLVDLCGLPRLKACRGNRWPLCSRATGRQGRYSANCVSAQSFLTRPLEESTFP
jgi:hypothetical protein